MMFKQAGSVLTIGRLTRDPEQFESKTGKTAPVKAAIAVGDKENVQFINLIAWYSIGDILMTAHKGDKIMIGGTEKKSTYYSEKRGEDVEKVEVDCETVFILERKSTGAATRPAPPPMPDMQEIDEDMPF